MLDRETQLGKGKPAEVIEKLQQEMQPQSATEVLFASSRTEVQKRRGRRVFGLSR